MGNEWNSLQKCVKFEKEKKREKKHKNKYKNETKEIYGIYLNGGNVMNLADTVTVDALLSMLAASAAG